MKYSDSESICYNCEYARRAYSKDKIACGYVFNGYTDYQKIMEDLNLERLFTGWGYMKRAVDDEEGKYLGSGIMTNGVVIFDKDFCCKHFKFRER